MIKPLTLYFQTLLCYPERIFWVLVFCAAFCTAARAVPISYVLPLADTSVCGVTHYNWPTASGQALLSDKYRVWVSDASGHETELKVLMSNAIYAGDFVSTEQVGRTFSFVNLSYDKAVCSGITFRVEKLYGTGASEVVLSPKSYKLVPTLEANGKTVKFSLNENNKYLSVNFKSSDNETTVRKWIKHMLCIYIDPKETDIPNPTAAGVVVYTPDVPAAALDAASTIYFPKGYHNLKNYTGGSSMIDTDGVMYLKANQAIYLEGGAYVEGLIDKNPSSNANQRFYGRGILSGRQYFWRNTPGYTGRDFRQIVNLGNKVKVQGVTIIDSPSHGIVAQETLVENVKMLGWHSNNDCVRVGSNSEIRNCFLRAVDDHFYNFNIWVHHSVLWAGHNGAILTYGWSGEDKPAYNAGSSLIEEIDIINPEWMSLGNNNGLIMSQVGYDFKPFGYGGSTQTVMRNIRIEGSIPGITNLKPRSSGTGTPIAKQIESAKVGYLGDLLLENISVEAQFNKGRILGGIDPDFDGNAIWYVKNVEFRNVRIGNTCVTDSNKTQFFNIDAATTQNLLFTGCSNVVDPTPIDITDLTGTVISCKSVALAWSDVSGETSYRIRRRIKGEISFLNIKDVAANVTRYMDTTANASTNYEYMVRPLVNGTAVKISNLASVTTPVCEDTRPKDCAGVSGGTAKLDSCGICSGGTTGIQPSAPKTWYADVDGDGNGDPNSILKSCTQPIGYVSIAGDECPQDSAKVVPGQCGCGNPENSCTPPDPNCAQAKPYTPTYLYNLTGIKVIYQGKLYENQWPTSGEIPGNPTGPWKLLGFCTSLSLNCSSLSPWNNNQIYTKPGTQVIYQGSAYTNRWYTKGNIPGQSTVWQYDGLCQTNSQQTMLVYPNPVTDVLTLDLAPNKGNYKIEVIDGLGQTRLIQPISSSDHLYTLSIRHLGAGIYKIRLYNSSGIQQVTVLQL